MRINPIRDRILVKPLESDTVTKSGIVIPDNAQEKPNQGEVLEVGGGRITEDGITIPMAVKKGDKVLYGKFSGQQIKIDNIEHIVLKEDDILAIVE